MFPFEQELYGPHALYTKHFWCFLNLERRIYTYFVYFRQRTLVTINVPFWARITGRTRFIESISGVFPHLERIIYTNLVCFCQRTLATINVPFWARIRGRTRFIERISGVFPHLERIIEWIRITRSLYADETHNILITSLCTHEIVFALECTGIIKIWARE